MNNFKSDKKFKDNIDKIQTDRKIFKQNHIIQTKNSTEHDTDHCTDTNKESTKLSNYFNNIKQNNVDSNCKILDNYNKSKNSFNIIQDSSFLDALYKSYKPNDLDSIFGDESIVRNFVDEISYL